MNTPEKASSLALKLATMLEEVHVLVESGAHIDIGAMRRIFTQHRVMILPSFKNHHEVDVLIDGEQRLRVTAIVEFTMIDGASGDQISSRWVGKAIGAQEDARDLAVDHAMEDFFKKTFFLPDFAPITQPRQTSIRRRPQGTHASSQVSSPASAPLQTQLPEEQPVKPADLDARGELVTQNQLALIDAMAAPETIEEPASEVVSDEAEARQEAREAAVIEYDMKAWKAANAQWRALVNEVTTQDVMQLFEDALEKKHDVDSWRKVTPEQIRKHCLKLKRRAKTCSALRQVTDREEFILSHLPYVPEGSALRRLTSELERLVLAVVDEDSWEQFVAVYLEKMTADSLSEVPGRNLVALVRKVRKLSLPDRLVFVNNALGTEETEAA